MKYNDSGINIAYLILCHKEFHQIVMLINSLALSGDDKAILHVDARNYGLLKKLKSHFKGESNVLFVSPPVKVFWSGFSQVQAMLALLELGCRTGCDFFCFLSGEDVLLKSPLKLKKYLFESNTSFIDGNYEADYSWRINHYNFLSDNRFRRHLMIRLFLRSLRIFQGLFSINRRHGFLSILKGSQWSVIKYSDAKIIIDSIDSVFIEKFNYTSCSDEHFFQISANEFIPNFKFKGNLHYMIFNEGDSSPLYLPLSELDVAKECSNVFFARKVNPDVARSFYENRVT